MSEFGDLNDKGFGGDVGERRDSSIIAWVLIVLLSMPIAFAIYFRDPTWLYGWVLPIILGLAG